MRRASTSRHDERHRAASQPGPGTATLASVGASTGVRHPMRWMHKRLRSGRESTRHLYAASRQLWMRRELARRRALAGELRAPPDLAIPRESGYRVLPPGRLPAADEVARATWRLAEGTTAPVGAKKPQLVTGLLPECELGPDSPFLRFALDPGLLACVSDYLGAVPLLAWIDVWASFASPEVATSQLFHCDWADLSQVKVFVHGSDVDRASGPLVVLGAAASQRLRQKLHYRWGGRRYRVADDEVAALVGDADRREIVGPAGTVALVDTSRCFHYGSRVDHRGPPRRVCAMQFLLPSAFSEPATSGSTLRALAASRTSELERLALGLA